MPAGPGPAVAVLSGWLVSRYAQGPARAALANGLALVCATTAYYGVDLLFDRGSWWGWVTRYWLIGSVLLGPPLGAAGAVLRRRGPVGMLAALLVPVGAAMQMLLYPPPPESLMALSVRLTVWIAAAVAVGWIFRGGSRHRTDASPAEPNTRRAIDVVAARDERIAADPEERPLLVTLQARGGVRVWP